MTILFGLADAYSNIGNVNVDIDSSIREGVIGLMLVNGKVSSVARAEWLQCSYIRLQIMVVVSLAPGFRRLF